MMRTILAFFSGLRFVYLEIHSLTERGVDAEQVGLRALKENNLVSLQGRR